MLARAPVARTATLAAPRARRAPARAVARASRADADADADADARRPIVGFAVAGALACALAAPARAEVTCNLITPCTPPPPNGEPRYKLPGSTYDPAAAAVARFEAARGAATTRAPAPTFGDDARRGEATTE